MRIKRVDLPMMLDARERRAEIQNKMLSGAGQDQCLVCLTLNIAGDIKRTPMTRMLFDRGVSDMESLNFSIHGSYKLDEPTGSEAFWLVDEKGSAVKSELERIEDSFPAARLFDFDVLVKPVISDAALPDFALQPIKLSRATSRKCLICDRPAAECARSRSHGLEAIKAATQNLLQDFCAKAIAQDAYSALLDELYTTPKPGLVDLANNGSHKDMDIPLFEKSAQSLKPYFYDAALMGMRGCTMEGLRSRGLEAEQEMFNATGGVNTHKGMIYSMGLMLAGMGSALTGSCIDDSNINEADHRIVDVAIRYSADLARQDAEQQLRKSLAAPKTNGGKVFKTYGAMGATGEAAAGFPGVVFCASRLQYYINAINDPDISDPAPGQVNANQAGVLAFCDSMARLDDTNLLHRGGQAGLDFAKAEASHISSIQSFDDRINELRKLDLEFINRNLSPGGSADMLALAYLLYRWDQYDL